MLVRAGILSDRQLEDLVEVAREHDVHLGQVLIARGVLQKSSLNASIEAQSAIKDRLCDTIEGVRALRKAIRSGQTFASALGSLRHRQTPAVPSNKLGQLFMEAGFISMEQFQSALEESAASGLPLGRCLVLSGAITEGLLELALELQMRVRDEMINRNEAIDALKSGKCDRAPSPGEFRRLAREARKHILRVGELLLATRSADNREILEAQEAAIASGRKIGQVLIERGIIDDTMLEATLSVQHMIDTRFLDVERAVRVLEHVKRHRVSVVTALSDLGLVKRRKFVTLGEIDPNIQAQSEHATICDATDCADEGGLADLGAHIESKLKQAPGKTYAPTFSNDLAARSEVSERLSSAYSTLARTEFAHGDYQAAQTLFERSVVHKERVYGKESKHLIDDLLNLAATLSFQSKLKESEKLLERVVRMVDGSKVSDLALTARCLSSLARVYVQLGRFNDAEPLLVRALAMKQLNLSEGDAEIIDTLKDYARLLVKTDRQDQADRLYLEARLASHDSKTD